MSINIKTGRLRARKRETKDTSSSNLRCLSKVELIEKVKSSENPKEKAIRHDLKLHKILQKEIEIEGAELSKKQNENF